MLPNNQWVNQKVKEEIKKKNTWINMKMKTQLSKIFDSKSCCKREDYSNSLPSRTKKNFK